MIVTMLRLQLLIHYDQFSTHWQVLIVILFALDYLKSPNGDWRYTSFQFYICTPKFSHQ